MRRDEILEIIDTCGSEISSIDIYNKLPKPISLGELHEFLDGLVDEEKINSRHDGSRRVVWSINR